MNKKIKRAIGLTSITAIFVLLWVAITLSFPKSFQFTAWPFSQIGIVNHWLVLPIILSFTVILLSIMWMICVFFTWCFNGDWKESLKTWDFRE
jgi:hypothetical protein